MKSVVRHAVGAFTISTIVLFLAGGIGAVVGTEFIQDFHVADEIGSTAINGGLIVLLVGFPAPFLLTAISTYTAFRGFDA